MSWFPFLQLQMAWNSVKGWVINLFKLNSYDIVSDPLNMNIMPRSGRAGRELTLVELKDHLMEVHKYSKFILYAWYIERATETMRFWRNWSGGIEHSKFMKCQRRWGDENERHFNEYSYVYSPQNGLYKIRVSN